MSNRVFGMKTHGYALICAVIVLLASACRPVASTVVPSTPTPVPPTATATPGQPDCTGPNAFPTEEATLVWPELREVEPDRVALGEKVTIRGSGGHLYWDNECGKSYVESAREFRLYLDGDQVGFIACYANTCLADLVVPDNVPAGVHTISVEGGSSLHLEVTGDATSAPLPTRPSTPAPSGTTASPHISIF